MSRHFGKIRLDRRGSATVFAMMVSMFLLLLITASVALTIADVELTRDYSRNKKSFQASDSGMAHGRRTMALATSSFNIPANTTREDVARYAQDAELGIETYNRDISLLVDTGGQAAGGNFESILSRGDVRTSGIVEYGGEETGSSISGYNVMFDVYPNPDNPVDHEESNDTAYRHIFHYNYEILSRGRSETGEQFHQASRTESGKFDIEVLRPSFSTYGYFTQGMKNQNNDQLVFYDGEVYDGPTHINSAPPEGRAGFWGSPVFNGPFTAVQAEYADSWLGGNADPIFNDSVTWGVEQIALPENGWSQLRAAVGDLDNVEDPSAVPDVELRQLLGLPANGDPVDEGVYYSSNYNTGSSLLGGILVKGDAQLIEFGIDGENQIIKITIAAADGEFAGVHTWEFRDIVDSNNIHVYMDGVLQGNTSGSLNGMIHVEGTIKRVIGESNGPEIQSDHQITLSAVEDILIADHIEYETDPITNPNALNILGLFSSNGNILLAEDAPSDLNLHATVMATGTGKGVGAEGIVGDGGAYNYGYANKGDWNLFGGLIENMNQTTGVFYSNGHQTGYSWNFTYDTRFEDGLAPPFFPYVTKFIIQMGQLQQTGWGRKYF